MRQHSGVLPILSTIAVFCLALAAPQWALGEGTPQPPPTQDVQQPATAPTTPAPGAASPVPSQPSAKAPAPKPPKIVLDNKKVEGVLGKEVIDAANEKMGRIIDVIVDRAGLVRAAVIDFGGFLGVGSRKIAVDWNALHFGTGKDHNEIRVELTRDQVKAAPQFEDGKPVVVLGALGDLDLPQLTSKAPER